MSKKIGILGGIGPEATSDMFKKLIKSTKAKSDQEHIETIIISNPQIPDRTRAIIHGEESPLSEMIKTAKILEQLGVEYIILPCNTAHYYYDELQKEISVPIINLIEETVNYICENFPHMTKVGLIATTGTIYAKIYDKKFNEKGMELIHVDEDVQENFVMEAIYGPKGIKAGYKIKPRSLLKYAALHLHNKGAQIIIKGCTEVALVLNKKNCEQPLIDPAKVVTDRLVAEFKEDIKSTAEEAPLIELDTLQ